LICSCSFIAASGERFAGGFQVDHQLANFGIEFTRNTGSG
jgi:hypothetical protein